MTTMTVILAPELFRKAQQLRAWAEKPEHRILAPEVSAGRRERRRQIRFDENIALAYWVTYSDERLVRVLYGWMPELRQFPPVGLMRALAAALFDFQSRISANGVLRPISVGHDGGHSGVYCMEEMTISDQEWS